MRLLILNKKLKNNESGGEVMLEKTVQVMMLWENLKASLRNQKGQGMVEYGLILALISVVVIGVLTTMGGNLKTMFESAASNIK
jgi:pilus assembly protein Flp/PilA